MRYSEATMLSSCRVEDKLTAAASGVYDETLLMLPRLCAEL